LYNGTNNWSERKTIYRGWLDYHSFFMLLTGYLGHIENQKMKWDSSPCGTRVLTDYGTLDTGKAVYRIKEPHHVIFDPPYPTAELELVFERTPAECGEWQLENKMQKRP
jgi:hypothetical protein